MTKVSNAKIEPARPDGVAWGWVTTTITKAFDALLPDGSVKRDSKGYPVQEFLKFEAHYQMAIPEGDVEAGRSQVLTACQELVDNHINDQISAAEQAYTPTA